MIRILLTIFALFMAFSTVSACSSGGTPVTDNPDDDGGNGNDGGGDNGGGGGGFVTDLFKVSDTERADFLANYEPTAKAEMARSSITSAPMNYAMMPDSGALDYTGYMLVNMGNAETDINAYGTMQLSISMSDSAISGSASNFLGSTPDENDDRQIVAMTGTLDILPGGFAVDDGDRAAVMFDMFGTLETGLNSFEVTTTLEGFVFGPNGEELWAQGLALGDGSFSGKIDDVALLPGVGYTAVSLNLNPSIP